MLSVQAVRDACHVDSRDRTERQVDDILAFVRDVKFFQTLDPHQQRALCRSAHVETFKSGDFIFHIGDHGQKFYVVLSGSVAVQGPEAAAFDRIASAALEKTHPIAQQPHPVVESQNSGPSNEMAPAPDGGLQTLALLERGMGFGEIALQSGQTRSATLQALEEPCELLVITKDSYERHAGQTHRRRIEERIDFIYRCPSVDQCLYSGSCTAQDIAAMANCLGEQTLCEHHILCRQGAPADLVFFVRSGSLAVFRTIEVDGNGRLVEPGEEEASLTERAKKARDWRKSMEQVQRQERSQRIGTPPPTAAYAEDRQPLDDQVSSSPSVNHLKRHSRSCSRASTKLLPPDGDDFEDVQNVIERKLDRHTRRTNPRRQRERLVLPPIGAGQLRSPTPMPVTTAAAQAAPVPLGRRKQVLRIGVIGPFQFFGDRQALENSRYPFSLVSEGAEVYVLSKGDLMRRLPKRLLAALFQRDESQYFWRDFPSDQMLLDLRRQNDRWQSYRRLICANAVDKTNDPSRPAAASFTQGSFRGQGANQRPGKELGRRDLEHFSGTRTHTLTRLWAMERGDYEGKTSGSQTERGRRKKGNLPPLSEREPTSGSSSARTFIDFAVEKYWAMRPGLEIDDEDDVDDACKLFS